MVHAHCHVFINDMMLQIDKEYTGFYDNDNDKQFIFRHVCPYNIKKIYIIYNVKTVTVHQEKQYKFYNHNLSSLFQYLCITLAIKNLYEFEIYTFDDFLILFIKLNTNFLLKGGKFKTSEIINVI